MHGAHLVLGLVAVRMRSLPRAGPHRSAAQLLVPEVDGGASCRLEMPPGKEAELDWSPRWARGRRTDHGLVRTSLLRIQTDARELAELPLTRAHRDGRVPLRELDGVEALGDRPLDVLRRHVLADAHEALATAAIGGRGGDSLEALARHAPDRLHARGELGRNEDAEIRVVLDARARFCEQRVRRLAAARRDEQVAVDALAIQDNLSDLTLASLRLELADARLAEIDDPRDGNPGLAQGVRRLEARVVRGEHDGAISGLQREVPHETADAFGQHDADEVVSGKDERLLGRAARDDDAFGAVAVEDGLAIDRDEVPFPDPERASRRKYLHPWQVGAEQARPLVDEDDARPRGGRRERRGTTGLSAPHDEHPRSPMLDVIAARVARVLVEPPEPGDAPQELLVRRPHEPWPDHRPVVEADGRERAADLVDDAQEVAVEAAEDVLRRDDRALSEGLDAHAYIRHAVDRHHAVRAMARAAQKAARAVVLEGAREDAAARGEESGSDGVAAVPLEVPRAETERDRPVAIDQLAALGREPHASSFAVSGRETASTSFVRVSRSARNHSPHPCRCCHHSR